MWGPRGSRAKRLGLTRGFACSNARCLCLPPFPLALPLCAPPLSLCVAPHEGAPPTPPPTLFFQKPSHATKKDTPRFPHPPTPRTQQLVMIALRKSPQKQKKLSGVWAERERACGRGGSSLSLNRLFLRLTTFFVFRPPLLLRPSVLPSTHADGRRAQGALPALGLVEHRARCGLGGDGDRMGRPAEFPLPLAIRRRSTPARSPTPHPPTHPHFLFSLLSRPKATPPSRPATLRPRPPRLARRSSSTRPTTSSSPTGRPRW